MFEFVEPENISINYFSITSYEQLCGNYKRYSCVLIACIGSEDVVYVFIKFKLLSHTNNQAVYNI